MTDMPTTPEEWGRAAVALPGWRWMPGMLGQNDVGGTDRIMDHTEASQPNLDLLPDPDDPATAGCLLALLGDLDEADALADSMFMKRDDCPADLVCNAVMTGKSSMIARACIAAAEALGRWPGGDL